MTDNAPEAKLEATEAKFKELPGMVQAGIVLGIFIGAGGRLWKDKKGFHARAYSSRPARLHLLKVLLGGRVVPIKRGRLIWTADTRAIVEWLGGQTKKLMPGEQLLNMDLAEQEDGLSPICPHCGWREGHDPECISNVDVS